MLFPLPQEISLGAFVIFFTGGAGSNSLGFLRILRSLKSRLGVHQGAAQMGEINICRLGITLGFRNLGS